MAFVVVASLLEIVEQQLLQPNPSLILHNKEMIVSLLHKLRFLQAFLEESGKKTNDPEVKEILDAVIRDLAVEVEGKIESKLRQVYLAANMGECVVVACQELHQTLEQVVKDIELVETRILMQTLNIASHVGSSTNDFKEENIMDGGVSQNGFETKNEIIVGFDEDKVEIMSRLSCSHSMKREVISLVGEGGIGKTTLAEIVFQDQSITTLFDIRAWVVVSQEHNLKEMLIGLLRCIVPMTSEISNKDEAQLAEQLCQSLMGHQRYLIVLDDIWTTTAWDAIQGCFPDNSNGSRILITTRFTKVADYLSVDPYHVNYQTLDDRWKLFSRKVFGLSRFVPQEYESIGKHIVLNCGGLPLAVVVIAGLLATVKESLEIWRDIAATLDGIDRYNNNKILQILSLSYNYLPRYLKACFQYFGVFPEDSNIPVKKLINLWVAEGFLKSQKNMSVEEVAESYLHDLINRSLVQTSELSIDGKIKSCRIHDRVHETCVREAKKENIVCIINENQGPEASRWLSCQTSDWPITQASYGNHTSDKIRSILCFGKDLYFSKCRLIYPCLKLLRVLDLSFIKYSRGMPSGITDLIHLRYLALSTIGSLYKLRFFKLQNLLTLIVASWMEQCRLQLPCDILDLPRLRHLRLEKTCSQYLPCVVRKNLQTLYWLKVVSSDEDLNFRLVPNLKELGICIEGELAPGCLESLVHLCRLEKLKFEMGRVECFSLPTCFPPNLKKLTLRYTYLPWKQIDIIGKLPNLEVLKLKDFAFCGPEWKPTKSGFRRLKLLLIARSDLQRWNVIPNHFPILECIVLRYCWDLKKVPLAFATIRTLKLIVLYSCYSTLVTSAEVIASTRMVFEMTNRALCVHHRGTLVELPNNKSSGEESVESFDEESVERSEEERVESSGEGSVESSEEEGVESLGKGSVESSEEEGVASSKEESVERPDERLKASKSMLKYLKKVSKAPKKNVLRDLKKKVSKTLRRK